MPVRLGMKLTGILQCIVGNGLINMLPNILMNYNYNRVYQK